MTCNSLRDHAIPRQARPSIATVDHKVTTRAVAQQRRNADAERARPELSVALDELQGSLLVRSACGEELETRLRLHHLSTFSNCALSNKSW